MRINTNLMAMNAQNKLRGNQNKVEKSIQKLSSGLRINSAADDAAGLAISEKMRAQIRGLGQAQDNAQDGISLIQTAEGALQQTTDILQRMRELVIKAQNTGVLTSDDRTSIMTEMSTLRDEIDRIATSTTFNSKKLLDGSLGVQRDLKNTEDNFKTLGLVDVVNANAGTTYTFKASADTKVQVVFQNEEGKTVTYESDITVVGQTITGKVNFAEAGIILNFGEKGIPAGSLNNTKVITADAKEGEKADFKIGANTYDEDVLSIGIGNMSSVGLNKNYDGKTKFSVDISTAENANTMLDVIDFAIDTVSTQRATLGAKQNRMEYAISSLSATEENLSAAESRIRDVDMANEMVSYTKNNILNQSAMAMLAQANQQPQQILSLLQ